ncbi:MAG: hypothetical protein V1895_03375 [Parcubacteria group bacterium]
MRQSKHRSSNHPTTKAERREIKRRQRMPVSGKHVFTLQRLAARQKFTTHVRQGPGRRGPQGRMSVRYASRINKPKHGQH